MMLISKAFSVSALAVLLLAASPAWAQNQGGDQTTGLPHDWSHQHLIFSNPGTVVDAAREGRLNRWKKVTSEPRLQLQRLQRGQAATAGTVSGKFEAAAVENERSFTALADTHGKKAVPVMHRDWSNVMGGAGGVGSAPNTYPAKYSFDITTASCANDFVVYPTGTAGAQPSGVAATRAGTFTTDPTVGGTVTLNGTNNSVVLTASTTSNTGLNFLANVGFATDATNLASAITRNGGAVGVTATSAAGVVTVTSINKGITTTLSAAMTTTSTAITVAAGTGFVNGDYIQIGTEKLLITAGGGTTSLTATRGQLGSTAATHLISAAVTNISDGGNSIASSTLGASMTTTTSTAITVAAGTGFGVGDYIVIDAEKLLITAVPTTTTLTATRGQLGTTAATHMINAVVSDISMPGGVTLLENLSTFTWAGNNLAGGSGTPGQPTIFALSNLYSGCGTTPAIAVPTTFWSYETTGTGTGSKTITSPVLSALGDQVAFVQTTSATAAELVILKWSSILSVGTVGAPTHLTNTTSAGYTTCIAPCMFTMAFSGGANDTNSSPFYDYGNDIIYVGDDSGNLHKFTGVFKGAPAEVVSAGVWPAAVSAGNKLTSPVNDSSTSKVYVGSASGASTGGSIHSVISTTGVVVTSPRLAVNSSTGIADAPLVDSGNSKVYVFVGDNVVDAQSAIYQYSTGTSVATQIPLKELVGSSNSATSTILYAGAFDNTYYSGTGTTGNLYVCSGHSSDADPVLFHVPINSGFTGTPVAGPQLVGAAACSPVTEVFNTPTSKDFVFFSVSANGADTGCTGACVYSYLLGTGGALGAAATAGLPAVGGASGIVIDNVATSPTGGSEVYFMTLGSPGNAVQATQSALN